MPGINKRVFGSDIDPKVKQKLYARQQLAGKHYSKDEVAGGYDDPTTQSTVAYSFGEAIGEMNFDGEADLSSRTPFARMWTAVQIYDPAEVTTWEATRGDMHETLTGTQSATLVSAQKKKGHTNVKRRYKDGRWVVEYVKKDAKEEEYETVIYTVGDNTLNTLSVEANDSRDYTLDVGGITTAQIAPGENETNSNEFMKPSAGITSISSNTEGALGTTKKTTVNFIVHNFHDFDKIYSRFFLKPGAQIFVDFGWDTSTLYNPEDMPFDEEFQENIETQVADAKGDLEVLTGVVTSYDAKFTENGSVECSVEIISKNNALLGNDFKNNNSLKSKISRALENEILQYAAKSFKGDTASRLSTANWSDVTTDESEFNKAFNRFATSALSSVDTNIPGESSKISGVYWYKAEENQRNIYISFGLFEDHLLNKTFALGEDDNDALTGKRFTPRFDSSESFMRYNHLMIRRQQLSGESDKLQFLYPEKWDKTYNTMRKKTPSDYDEDVSSRTEHDKNRQRMPLRELFIPINLIKKAFDETNDVSSLMKHILDAINDDSAGAFKLQLYSGQDDSKISVIDFNSPAISAGQHERNYFNNLFVFKPHSKNSIVKSFDFSLSTPQGGIGSMIAIGARNPNTTIYPITDFMDRALAMELIEQSFTESGDSTDKKKIGVRYLPKAGEGGANRIADDADSGKDLDIGSDEQNIFGETQEMKLELDKVDATFIDSSLSSAAPKASGESIGEKIIGKSGEEKEDNSDKISAMDKEKGNLVTNTLKEYYDKIIRSTTVMEIPTMLPITVSLSIYGISSLIPGDVFRVDYLPQKYKDWVYFQVTKVSHDLSSSTWTTTLETVMRIRKEIKREEGINNIYKASNVPVVLHKSILDKSPAKCHDILNYNPAGMFEGEIGGGGKNYISMLKLDITNTFRD